MVANPQLENGYLRIANEIMEALARVRIPGEARQILDVIFRKTYGFQKKADAISLSQFSYLTGLSRRSAQRAISQLLTMNIIRKRADARPITYSFNKNYEQWKPSAKRRTVRKKADRVSAKKRTKLSAKTRTTKEKKDTITKERDAVTSHEHRRMIDYWSEQYRLRFHCPYQFCRGKDDQIVKALLATFGADLLRRVMDDFLECDDEWVKEKGYTLAILSTQANRIAQRLTRDSATTAGQQPIPHKPPGYGDHWSRSGTTPTAEQLRERERKCSNH